MAITNKIFNRLTVCCASAIFAGVMVVAVFAAMLSAYGENQETITVVPVHQAMKFPENEKMLNDISAQLAREGAALSEIAPAAGDAASAK